MEPFATYHTGHRCDGCLKTTERDMMLLFGVEKLSKCSSCQKVYYCSRECQIKAWNKYHKTECKVFKQVPGSIQESQYSLLHRVFLTHHLQKTSSSGGLNVLEHVVFQGTAASPAMQSQHEMIGMVINMFYPQIEIDSFMNKIIPVVSLGFISSLDNIQSLFPMYLLIVDIRQV